VKEGTAGAPGASNGKRMRRSHVLAVGGVATLALLWLLVTMGDHASPARRHLPRQQVELPFDATEGAEPPAQEPPVEAPTPKPPDPKTVAVVAPAPTIADRLAVAPGEDVAEAWARTVEAALSTEERKALDRHLTRFVRVQVPDADPPPAGNVTAKADFLPKASPEDSEKRRLEQLELLRQRKAVLLLDHIDAGLAWLALHQGPDGKISDSTAAARCAELGHKPACVLPWNDGQYAVATTGLSVVALLDFRDQDKWGLFEPTLARAVSWLHAQQQGDGAFPGRAHYSTAIALLALAQAASSSGSEELRESVRRGLRYLATQAGRDGGYRYTTGDAGDLSVTAWVGQAVEAARRAKVEIPPWMEEGIRRFLDDVWLRDHRFSYMVGRNERPSLDPAGMLLGLIERDVPCSAGTCRCSGEAVEGTWRTWLVAAPPAGLYSLYYGVRVAILLEGDLPGSWRAAILKLADTQEHEGAAAGAFRRVKVNGAAGVVLQTVFATLTLEHVLYKR
jgi:hypothetical protein